MGQDLGKACGSVWGRARIRVWAGLWVWVGHVLGSG